MVSSVVVAVYEVDGKVGGIPVRSDFSHAVCISGVWCCEKARSL